MSDVVEVILGVAFLAWCAYAWYVTCTDRGSR